MIALTFTIPTPVIVAVQSASEFSRSMERHAMASSHSTQEIALVVLGALVVAVTTACTLRYLARPGETDANHVKRRILDEDRRECR